MGFEEPTEPNSWRVAGSPLRVIAQSVLAVQFRPTVKYGSGQLQQAKLSLNNVRPFLSALKSEDSGLFVSIGGFTNPAKQEAETSREPVTILNRDDFIQLLLEHYEELEPEFKSKVPLRRLWVPIEE